MSRIVWMAVGAVGGIVAYRKGTQMLADAKARGVIGNVNAATTTATTIASRARDAVAVASGQRGDSAGDTLRTWIPQRSDVDSSTTLPNAPTKSFPAPR